MGIDEGRAGEVAAYEVGPLVVLFEEPESWFGEFPVEIPAESRSVVAVISADRGQLESFLWKQIQPLLGDVAGDVGKKEAGAEEEGLIVLLFELTDGP